MSYIPTYRLFTTDEDEYAKKPFHVIDKKTGRLQLNIDDIYMSNEFIEIIKAFNKILLEIPEELYLKIEAKIIADEL